MSVVKKGMGWSEQHVYLPQTRASYGLEDPSLRAASGAAPILDGFGNAMSGGHEPKNAVPDCTPHPPSADLKYVALCPRSSNHSAKSRPRDVRVTLSRRSG